MYGLEESEHGGLVRGALLDTLESAQNSSVEDRCPDEGVAAVPWGWSGMEGVESELRAGPDPLARHA